ncbi:DUF5133 domain-containing protein [Streptomyces sp. NPDC005931]|uniref:DUF5133 domain-containing protein n=1 Tax=Streptomyces sp. NPDC005931 TaxID=3364737 RepID=UPI00368105E9
MLLAHPGVLNELVAQYEVLAAQDAEDPSAGDVRRRREDIAYTLCVLTGTREVGRALAVARQRLGTASAGDAALTG